MNKERRVGRRSVVRNLKKLTPQYNSEDEVSKGPKKSLFNDDSSFVMKRTLKPLHEINHNELSSHKSKSHEKLYDESELYDEEPTYKFMEVFNKHNKIPLSPPSNIGLLESSFMKKTRELSEPKLQSKDLFNTLIDSPCTKLEKAQFNHALSSASNYLLNRHLESIQKNADIFKVTTPETNFPSTNEINLNEFKTPHLIDLSITPKQNISKSDCQTQISSIPLLVDEIEELKKNQIEDIRHTKLQCCNLIKTKFHDIELEIEKHFSAVENKVTENYNKLLKKVQDDKNDNVESETLDVTLEIAKEKNYTRMTGAYGILNNLKYDCSFLKTPKTKGKTREEINKGTLTPCTMSFVIQEQLMHLNSSS